MDIDDEPLVSVIKQVEKDHGISFSYQDDLIKGIKVSGRFKEAPLEKFLGELLSGHDLTFELLKGKFVLIIPREEAEVPPPDNRPPPLSLCGKVKDEITGEALPYINVYIQGTTMGVAGDANGHFQLKGRFSEKDTVVVSFVGYQNRKLLAADLLGRPCGELGLRTGGYQSVEVKVTGYLMDGIYLGSDAHEVKIQPNKMSISPGQAEPDVMQSVQLLPGASSPDESASRIYLRGGTPDQNLVLWDGIPVYHTGHFFGNISAFNPYIVDEVNVWRGAFGAEYGGRVSGIIDINSTQEITEGIRAGAGMNFTHGHAFAEVPIWENKSSLILSYRRAFTDFWESPTFSSLKEKTFQGQTVPESEDGDENEDEGGENTLELVNQFYFYDANAKWLFHPNEKDKFQVSFFTGKNTLNYEVDNSLDEDYIVSDAMQLNNWGLSGEWRREWNDKFSSKINGAYSDYSYNYQNLIQEDSLEKDLVSVGKSNTVKDIRVRLENRYALAKHHRIEGGYHFTQQTVGFNIEERLFFEGDYTSTEDTKANTHSLFADYVFQNKDWLLNGGVRTPLFLAMASPARPQTQGQRRHEQPIPQPTHRI
jgi:hypothetical protein